MMFVSQAINETKYSIGFSLCFLNLPINLIAQISFNIDFYLQSIGYIKVLFGE
ncbi:hypothetical protein SARI_02095 [Salmonella enterica subsp. arizonae serovar 62:z4,z23:-]|uniref:Uncharacterized protein n=1 Tax=Salmonella arizonae (strain ATCC BAA-731 / CDC346-86 / RSK2980) TaxID=41514 RepID=A9MIR9_SALAR|nr:hypothetical protein SARI_02095 [Salmonella enterica subsp. arizonae serovar 62:z4,z23:-]